MSLVEMQRLRKIPLSRGKTAGVLPEVSESYPAQAQSVTQARREIAEFARAVGATDLQLDAIRLATSEALTNIVLYAYPFRDGEIHVTVRLAAGELWILIADDGRGIHAGADSDGLGLGLALISQVTDGLSIVERSSGGTELQLRFVLAAATAA